MIKSDGGQVETAPEAIFTFSSQWDHYFPVTSYKFLSPSIGPKASIPAGNTGSVLAEQEHNTEQLCAFIMECR